MKAEHPSEATRRAQALLDARLCLRDLEQNTPQSPVTAMLRHLIQHVETLETALREYGQHRGGCRIFSRVSAPKCSCGFDTAVSVLAGEEPPHAE